MSRTRIGDGVKGRSKKRAIRGENEENEEWEVERKREDGARVA